MTRVWISIGSNLDRERSVRGAVRELRRRFGELTLSRVYETESVGYPGPPFFNLVAGFDTSESPEMLQRLFHQLEADFGRVRQADKNAPRTLDVDLLTYGDMVRRDGAVELPRDEILRYGFVLGPLAEVAPQEIHPLAKRSYADLWADFDRDAQPLCPMYLDLEESA